MMSFRFAIVLTLLVISRCYDPNYALKYAGMAYAAYCPPDKLTSWNTGIVSERFPQVRDITVIQNSGKDLQAYLAYMPDENAIVITFRGSSNISNWMMNIKFLFTDYPNCSGCKVHYGFMDAYMNIKPYIDMTLTEYQAQYPTAKIILNGHSLGGVMATLMAGDLYTRGISVAYLQTIGSPRIGNQQFFNWFEQQASTTTHFRITHFHDPVVHLPQETFGFAHVNLEVFYNTADSTSYKVCSDQYGGDSTCSRTQSYDILSFQDHQNYLGYVGSQIC